MKAEKKAKAKTNNEKMGRLLAVSKNGITIAEVEGTAREIESCLFAVMSTLCENVKMRKIVYSVCMDTIKKIKKGECEK